MLPPGYFDYAADDIIELYAKLDESITRDVVRRLVKTGRITSSAEWQILRLQESGVLYNDIIDRVSRLTNESNRRIRELFEDAGLKSVELENEIYRAAGLSPPPLRQSLGALQVLRAGINKTAGHINNLSMTTAVSTQQSFINAVTLAEMQVESGAFSYISAIKNAVSTVSQTGATVIYPTGHVDKADVAVRRAVLTGVGQTTGQITEWYAENMGCDLVEVTAHAGARSGNGVANHLGWQGKIYSRSGKSRKYPDFVEATGYGTGPGLKGWNCRHDFYCFYEGISESVYPHRKLQEYEEKTVIYNDQEIPYYNATQMQRAHEREIRKTKRELAGLDSGIKSTENEQLRNALNEQFQTDSAKLKNQERQLNEFLRQTNLTKQSDRQQVQGFNRSVSAKAVQAAER